MNEVENPERPGAFGCVLRRSLAKATDIVVAIAVSQGLSTLLLGQSLQFDGLVPFFASTGWLLGVFIALDSGLAYVFGATVGEFIMGLRVFSLHHKRLSFSQRQDRTTDALVEGTLGCVPLVAKLWRGEQAPYDADCRVVYLTCMPREVFLKSSRFQGSAPCTR